MSASTEGHTQRMHKVEPGIREAIMAAYVALPPGERKLADTVLARLGNLASYSATELAGAAAVSKATAARFFRRIGYQSFAQARQRARADAQQASPLSGLAGASAKTRGSDALAQHLAADLRNLSESFRQLDRHMLAAAVALLAKAARVHVVGLRNGHFIAAHAAYLLAQAREAVAVVPDAAMTLAEDLVSLRRGDVLLVVDFRRRSALLPSIVSAARQAGARLVFLASPAQPPLARAGDVALHCLTEGSSMFDSYVAALSIVNHLCTAVAKELGKTSRRRLEAIETLHDCLGDIRA
jgi:DNA-binding MurR/RpiR family transcriptional regulator